MSLPIFLKIRDAIATKLLMVATLSLLSIVISQPALCQELSKRTASKQKEIWAECRIGGTQAGYYHEQQSEDQEGQILTSTENDVIFNRMGSKVEIRSSSRSDESATGVLHRVSSEMSSSAQSTRIEAVVNANSLSIHTSTGGKTYDRTLSFSGEILGPAAVRNVMNSRLKSPGDEISYQVFSPELGLVVTVNDKFVATESVKVGGEVEPARKLEQKMSAMPGTTMVWLDSTGWLVRQSSPSPLGDIEILRASAENIQKAEIKGATLPQETFASTLVKSNVMLPEERLIERLTLRVTHKKPELGWPDFAADNQKVLEKAPDHVVLEIRRIVPKHNGRRPLQAADPKLLPLLQPNALLQSDDTAVRDIAAQVVGDNADAFQAARHLQAWTNQNMQFDLGIAIAPASEVARNKRGTCFGYAILLASLARAEGIPSRLRMGFVYAGGIWGGHAWVDVLAGDEWIPLDGALYSPGPTDAAHMSFFTSGLEEGTIAQVGELAKLYGNVNIEILSYTIHGKTIAVPPAAKSYSVDGDTYRNPWLGLIVVKPKSFHFTTVNALWPASTIVAMEGPDGQEVEIENHSSSMPVDQQAAEKVFLEQAGIAGTESERQIAGRRLAVVSSSDIAGAVLRRGGDNFVLKVKSPHADELLMKIASGIQLQE